MLKHLLIGFLLFIALISNAQKNSNDSLRRFFMAGLQFSAQLPGADLQKRYGSSLSVGTPLYYKTKKNLVFGLDANYIFGSTLHEDVLSSIRTPEGTINNADGNPGDVRLSERGWNVSLKAGKILPLLAANKNSGLLLMFGMGYLQHKIKLYDVGKNVVQVYGDLKKGYDRLSGGFALSQFVGYVYLSSSRLANFYVGFECTEGFTKGLRGYQYDLMQKDNAKRFDLLYGFRLGWLLPMYRREASDYYY